MTESPDKPPPPPLPRYTRFLKGRRLIRKQQRKERKNRPQKSPPPPDSRLKMPIENLINTSIVEVQEIHETRRVDRSKFGPGASIHSTYKTVTRHELKIVVVKRIIKIETARNIHSDELPVRADVMDIGPAKSQVTWATIAMILCMTVSAAIPFFRTGKLLCNKLGVFTAVQVNRWVIKAARMWLPLYLCLAEQLADARGVIAADDSKTRVLEMEDRMRCGVVGAENEKLDPMVEAVADVLGRSFPRKDGKGPKAEINVTVVTGRTELDDPRSMIYFFRTHFGSAGNLLTKLLSDRNPKAGKVILQSDLATTNLPDELLRARFILQMVGCTQHARRPFARYRDYDDELCDFMLKAFGMLTWVEKRIDATGRTWDNTIRLRRKFSLKIWKLIRAKAESVLQAERPDQTRGHYVWPPGSKLYIGCQYIVNHFAKLTAYIDNPLIEMTNNLRERLLRGEKMLLVSSKFRKTERGRVALDIIRTVVMTATAAGVPLIQYLVWLFRNADDMNERPQEFTPFAYAKHLEAEARPMKAAS